MHNRALNSSLNAGLPLYSNHYASMNTNKQNAVMRDSSENIENSYFNDTNLNANGIAQVVTIPSHDHVNKENARERSDSVNVPGPTNSNRSASISTQSNSIPRINVLSEPQRLDVPVPSRSRDSDPRVQQSQGSEPEEFHRINQMSDNENTQQQMRNTHSSGWIP